MRETRWSFLAACLLTAMGLSAKAELAITEVMSQSSMSNTNFRGPDFFEVTNFGTNAVDLHGYGFGDNNLTLNFTYPFDNLIIRSGESIIFCRSNTWVRSREDFITWWGETNVPSDLQVRMYLAPGFDGEAADEVRLRDPAMNLVDWVAFGSAREARTFTYDHETGVFGTTSIAGKDRAFQAAGSEDVGSPGWTTGPIPVSIREQPASQTVDGCGSVQLEIRAEGLPRPRYQWFFNREPIANDAASILVISNVVANGSGEFFVIVSNCLTAVTSSVATLTVSTNPLPPRIVMPPQASTVFPGQTAFFSVAARGFPCLNFQWQLNGQDLPGATNPAVEIKIAFAAFPGSNQCRVLVWNETGATNAGAALFIVPRPRLEITEVMSEPLNAAFSPHKDWFELTNMGTNAVDLKGYRVNDSPSFYSATVITQSVVIQPGESIIFVEFMSQTAFTAWWGAPNLPANLQVIAWGRFALDREGDEIYVWNPGATDVYDAITSVNFPSTIDGVSFEMNNYCDSFGCYARYLQDSAPGINGAFHAVESGDIGSPGYLANPPPRILEIRRGNPILNLKCRVNEGKAYRLEYKSELTAGGWAQRPPFTATNSVIELEDIPSSAAATGFYRLEELP